jgi:aldose 1-epimerase
VTRFPQLNAGDARLRLAPGTGGGIVDLVLRGEEEAGEEAEVPILRPWAGDGTGPFGLALNVLAPFSNRLSGGGFAHPPATFHEIAPNLPGEPCPIHGDAFQREWDLVEQSERRARMVLPAGAIGPFRYRAEVGYDLAEHGLRIDLKMVNQGPALPFGGGFHPWFPRLKDTRLRFGAGEIQLQDSRYLPAGWASLDQRPDWDFREARALPDSWINNAFTGWDGAATIVQPGLGLQIEVTAAPPLETAIVYSPDGDADFFCFEPVSHAVDAHNRPGLPGLKLLSEGEALDLTMGLSWRGIAGAARGSAR